MLLVGSQRLISLFASSFFFMFAIMSAIASGEAFRKFLLEFIVRLLRSSFTSYSRLDDCIELFPSYSVTKTERSPPSPGIVCETCSFGSIVLLACEALLYLMLMLLTPLPRDIGLSLTELGLIFLMFTDFINCPRLLLRWSLLNLND